MFHQELAAQNTSSSDEEEREVINSGTNTSTSDDLGDIAIEASKLMQLMGLGKIEKGALDRKAKFKSLNERWYNEESSKKTVHERQHDSGLFLQVSSRIVLEMKRGGAVELASYKVLCLFTKSSNKWFVSEENKFPWVNGSMSNGKGRVLARLVKSIGSSYKEMRLEKDGAYGPHHVFQCVLFDKIVNVQNNLTDM